jgi:acyl-coenzyme A synthetase/AMP-(fatty) acid ligase
VLPRLPGGAPTSTASRRRLVLSGDLATLDDAGYLRITDGRDIIIRKGGTSRASWRTRSPRAVAEVVVVGAPDAAAGEIACAVVNARTGHAALASPTPATSPAHGLEKAT